MSEMETETNKPRIVLFRRRHVFVGDEYVGKYDGVRRSLVLVKEHEGKREMVRAWFKSRMGICPRKG